MRFAICTLSLPLLMTFATFGSTGSLGAQGADASGSARAQMEAARARTVAAMAPVKWMLGEWEGPATVEYAPGQKLALTQRETVTEAAFGTALLIHGRGTMNAGGVERGVFDAAGLLSYDLPSNRFFFAATAGTGSVGSKEMTVDGNTVTWYLDAAGARTRYVIRHTEQDEWHEVGAVSHDGGKTFVQNFEMRLKRKK